MPGTSQQAAARSVSGSCGSSTGQRSNATGQRGWKRQPVGIAVASGGSPCSSTRAPVRGSSAGRPPAGPSCTGCCGSPRTCSVVPISTIRPEVHHRDAVAHRPGNPDVVGDQEQRERARACAGRRAVAAPACAPRRRAPRPARRTRAPRARARARPRSRRAGAGRPRARAEATPEAVGGREPGVVQRRDAALHALLAARACRSPRAPPAPSAPTVRRGLSDW